VIQVLAKTARDALMQRLDAEHPGYGFAKHKGYPVRDHLIALKRLGACPIHRRSVGPVRTVMGLPPRLFVTRKGNPGIG
jgi:ribonuclease HII